MWPLLFLLAAAPSAQDRTRAVDVAEASQTSPAFEQLIEDMVHELVLDLAKLATAEISPLAIDAVTATPELSREVAERVRFMASAKVRDIPGLVEVHCIGCDDATTVSAQDGQWRFSRDDTDMASVRARAARVGAQTFLSMRVEMNGQTLALSARIIDAFSSGVVFAKRYLSNEKRAALDLRGRETVEQRSTELATMTRRPWLFGHSLFLGVLQMPWVYANGAARGSINGLSLTYRLNEIFGDDRQFLIGLQVQAFVDPFSSLPLGKPLPVSGGLATLIFAYTLKFRDLRVPHFRTGALVGGYIGGSLGNNFAAGGIFEVQMRFRLGFNLALMYVRPSDLQATLNIPLTVGGFTWTLGSSFNWD
jgi:hypothetical protein